MAILITDECINCGACEPECPNTAIYEGGIEWSMAAGTSLTEVTDANGNIVDANTSIEPPMSFTILLLKSVLSAMDFMMNLNALLFAL